MVYVPPRPRFRYHRENKKITHNYLNYVVEKYFNCPNICNIDLYNVSQDPISLYLLLRVNQGN